jgi:nicotinate-nucleotide pyrophosphorylase (carboxylating)
MTQQLSKRVRRWLSDEGLDADAVTKLLRHAIAEDLGGGRDVTTRATVPKEQVATLILRSRRVGVVAGLRVALAVFDLVAEGSATLEPLVGEGASVVGGQDLARITARTRDLLVAERTALNLLCHLSGVATLTRTWVDAVAGSGAVIRDTRKTTPGLRALEKFAVRCGGGQNHRMSLSDAALIKDNHVAAAGGVAAAVQAVRNKTPKLAVEVEVDTLEELDEALTIGVDLILLDNMSPSVLAVAVARARESASRSGHPVLLEASGGISLASARAVAESGVDFLAIGALTHSAPVLDIGADFQGVATS